MKKKKLMQMMLIFVFALNALTMKAQDINNKSSVLNAHQQSMAAIAMLTATGNLDQLKTELNTGLDVGLKINEIKEALVQLYAYCGFPRSLNAINIFKEVLDERSKRGIKDTLGKEIIVENTNSDRYEQGRKVLEELTKSPQSKPAPGFGEFAPRADAFLKEHLFADIFASDVLNFRQREFITISALAAMQGVEPQLKAHIAMGKNTGVTNQQLEALCLIIEKMAGRAQANILRKQIGEAELSLVQSDMMVRISEIEIVPQFLDQYKAILKEESSASVEIEPGVIAIYPMFKKESPNQVRIIEIYANKEAYQSHLKTPHFQLYKTSTLNMVSSLKLVDMDALDVEHMNRIFVKLSKQ